MVTRKEILELSANNSLLHEAVSRWRAGELTWEQAMMEVVFHTTDLGVEILPFLPSGTDASSPLI